VFKTSVHQRQLISSEEKEKVAHRIGENIRLFVSGKGLIQNM
jgi:hypothetical protein